MAIGKKRALDRSIHNLHSSMESGHAGKDEDATLRAIPLERLQPHPNNPRDENVVRIEELVNSRFSSKEGGLSKAFERMELEEEGYRLEDISDLKKYPDWVDYIKCYIPDKTIAYKQAKNYFRQMIELSYAVYSTPDTVKFTPISVKASGDGYTVLVGHRRRISHLLLNRKVIYSTPPIPVGQLSEIEELGFQVSENNNSSTISTSRILQSMKQTKVLVEKTNPKNGVKRIDIQKALKLTQEQIKRLWPVLDSPLVYDAGVKGYVESPRVLYDIVKKPFDEQVEILKTYKYTAPNDIKKIENIEIKSIKNKGGRKKTTIKLTAIDNAEFANKLLKTLLRQKDFTQFKDEIMGLDDKEDPLALLEDRLNRIINIANSLDIKEFS